MEERILDKAKILFESYNMAMEESYNRLFSSMKPADILQMNQEAMEPIIAQGLESWAETPLPELDSQSPQEFFAKEISMDAVIDLFIAGADICDGKLPEPLLKRLKSFGEPAVAALIKLVDSRPSEKDERYMAGVMAVKVLGEWKAEQAVALFLDLLGRYAGEDDLMAEEITGAVANLGAFAANPVISRLEAVEVVGEAEEYLLQILMRIGKEKKSEVIFRCLKDTFRKMNNKVIGAMCLGDYGDGRAIPALRGYVEKNIGTIDRETFMEIKAAVQRLGGSIDDMRWAEQDERRETSDWD
jgi:hypothetical protein